MEPAVAAESVPARGPGAPEHRLKGGGRANAVPPLHDDARRALKGKIAARRVAETRRADFPLVGHRRGPSSSPISLASLPAASRDRLAGAGRRQQEAGRLAPVDDDYAV